MFFESTMLLLFLCAQARSLCAALPHFFCRTKENKNALFSATNPLRAGARALLRGVVLQLLALAQRALVGAQPLLRQLVAALLRVSAATLRAR